MEFLEYVRLVQRWSLLIVVAAFVGGSISFVAFQSRPPNYEAQVLIAIGNYIQSPNPDSTDIRAGQELAQTYEALVRTYDILNGVVDTLNAPFTADELEEFVNTDIIIGTSLLRLTVTHNDPLLAADVANEIARQLILQSPTNLTPAQQAQVDLLNDQIRVQSEDLTRLRQQLSEVETSLASEDVSADSALVFRQERTVLVDQINEASANIGQFTNTIAGFQQRTNSVEIVETARIPTEAVGVQVFGSVIFGAIATSGVAFGLILVYEYLNDTFRNPDEVTRVLNLPVLGVVSRFGSKNDSYFQRLLVNLPTFSQPVEEYRTLRTNLLYASGKENRVFLITSASPREGKSVTASNLAVSMALSGLRVLLVDADLRKPRVHQAFNLPNQVGLTTILTRNIDARREGQAAPVDRVLTKDTWQKVVQQTAVTNLFVLTSGFLPTNPVELLGSALMKRWMEEFRKSPHVDVIIIDSPPVLAVTDSVVISAMLNAKVVLVIEANRTPRNIGLRAKERFEAIDADMIGVVLNAADLRDEDYYGYSYGQYYSDFEQQPSD